MTRSTSEGDFPRMRALHKGSKDILLEETSRDRLARRLLKESISRFEYGDSVWGQKYEEQRRPKSKLARVLGEFLDRRHKRA